LIWKGFCWRDLLIDWRGATLFHADELTAITAT
jgi:hypothetical protein